jgi:two-component system sensor histidine kinase HydH
MYTSGFIVFRRNKFEDAMKIKANRRSRANLHQSPWIIIGSVAILLIVVVVLAYKNYSREKQYMSRILSEKGAAIIKAMEAGARTGMMGMMWGGQQVQTLITETATLPDVLYITLTDRDGRVLASSIDGLIGSQINTNEDADYLKPTNDIDWRLKSISDQQYSFEVIDIFDRFQL